MRNAQTNNKSKGQALVEMAFVLFLLLLLVLGIFEFGRAMYIKNTLTHSARAGARTAVVTPGINKGSSTGDAGCSYGTTENDVVFKSTCMSLYSAIDKSKTTFDIKVYSPDGTEKTSADAVPGDTVKVTVTLSGFTSVVPNFIPVPNTLSGDTAMRYE